MNPKKRFFLNLSVKCEKEALSAGFTESLGSEIMDICLKIVQGEMSDNAFGETVNAMVKSHCKTVDEVKALMTLFEEIVRAVEQFVKYFHNTNEEEKTLHTGKF